MKKSLLIISFFLLQVAAQGQSIPNANFENWTNFNYDEPFQWYSSNSETVPAFSIPTVAPVAGVSNLAARIETYIIGLDTLKGVISNSIMDVVAGEGGVPYTDMPTAIEGFYRYELPVDDTALILVIFKNAGTILSTDLIKIKGTGSEPTFVPFSFPLTLAATPDSVVIACTASNLMTNQGIESGSWIEYDELSFTGPSVTQPIPNGSMDNWTNQSVDFPLSWLVFGSGVTQSTDAYSGSFALGLETTGTGSNAEISGATNGQDFGQGGYPYTNMIDSLVGFYKYLTSGNDTAGAYISVTSGGVSVGGGLFSFLPAATYTPFSIPLNAGATPDTMRIEFFSSIADSSLDGSILLIDQLDLQSIITGINSNLDKNSNLFSAYPNPFSDRIKISYNGDSRDMKLYLYNTIGEIIHESGTSNNSFEMELSQLPAGCYWLKMISGNNISVRKIIKQ
jgi:hypothetical protein